MAADNIRELQDKLLADDNLREEFRQSPHEVLSRHGIELTEEQSQRLHEANLAGQSHDEIKSKVQTYGLHSMW